MKVIATAVGYHGKIRQPGDLFDVAEGSKASWYKPVDDPTESPRGRRQAASAEAKAAGGLV